MSAKSLIYFLFAAGAAQAAVFTENETEQKVMWEAFKLEHGKSYETTSEEDRRFGFFVDNLKLADEHHAEAAASGIQDHSRHGVTQFFDLDLVSRLGFVTIITILFNHNIY